MSKLRKRIDSNNTKYISGLLHIECKDCYKFLLADKSNFHTRKDTTLGFRSTCKSCFSKRREVKRNSVEGKLQTKGYRLKHSFGLSLDDFNGMRVKQDMRCPICERTEAEFVSTTTSGAIKGFVVDHNHQSGEVRGLLCNECNVGLGFLKDSPTMLVNALDYLDKVGHYGK